MSWKTLLVLVVLAAGLGGFYYYDSYWLSPARDKAEQAKGRLWAVEPRDVESVTITRKDETIRLKRAESGWELLEPVKARADRGSVDGVVTSLATIRMDREIDGSPATLADFGLDPPEARIALEVKGRPEPLVLLVGVKSPTGAWVYGKEGSKPAVLALSEIVSRDVARPVADFRDKTVLALDRKSVSALDFEVDGERISLEAGEPGKWRIVKPRPYAADAELVADFLDKVESVRVKEFVTDAPTSLTPYGLDRPATVTVWLGREKDRSSRAVHFGRVDKDKKGVYVMRAGEPTVMLAPEELWTLFPKTVAALRDKVVVAYAYDKVSRVELEHARGKVAIEREGTSWKITQPEGLKADSGQVNSLLWKLRDMRAVGFLAEDAREIPRYLGKPDVTVRLWEEGAKEPKTLLLAASRETRGGQPAAVAAVAGQGPVMLVEGKALQELSKGPDDLRDRTVFPAFELDDVQRARIAAGDKRVVVERSGRSEWKVVEPARGAGDSAKVSDLLLTLKALRWKAIVSEKGDDAARFGLDRPELDVTLLKKDGAEIAGLLVGRQEQGLTYVRLKASPTIYSVESRVLADLRKAPTDLPG